MRQIEEWLRDSARYRAMFVIVLILIGLGALFLDAMAMEDPRIGSTRTVSERWWAFRPLVAPGDSLAAAIPTFANVRTRYPLYIGMNAGLAARDIAGGRPESITYPTPSSIVQVADEKGQRNGVNVWYLGALSGYNARQQIYRVRVSPQTVAAWEEQGRLREYDWNVWAVIPDQPEGRVVLHQDFERGRLFVVPESLSPEFSDGDRP